MKEDLFKIAIKGFREAEASEIKSVFNTHSRCGDRYRTYEIEIERLISTLSCHPAHESIGILDVYSLSVVRPRSLEEYGLTAERVNNVNPNTEIKRQQAEELTEVYDIVHKKFQDCLRRQKQAHAGTA
jgi:hypothetical protein